MNDQQKPTPGEDQRAEIERNIGIVSEMIDELKRTPPENVRAALDYMRYLNERKR